MRLVRLDLSNIRSYVSETVAFPSGSVLLAGDIGSGKSTLLLAIEFALFGLKTGELTGGALLRHGEREGRVALTFSVEGKEITIVRTLKASKDRVGQSKGELIVDGVREELMPKELKSRIYRLLAYPLSSVGKAQDLLWRYTVYTPQEQMKQILFEDRETRLETLRKVFDLDRYKRIKENASLYGKGLREEMGELKGKSEGLEEAKTSLSTLHTDGKKTNEDVKEKAAKAVQARERLAAARTALEALEAAAKAQEKKRLELRALDEQIKQVLIRRNEEKKEQESLAAEIATLEKESKADEDIDELAAAISRQRAAIEDAETALLSCRRERAELSGSVASIKERFSTMKELSTCPLCQQDVPHEHKSSVMAQTNTQIEKLKAKDAALNDDETRLTANVSTAKERLDLLQRRHQEARISLERAKVLSEKQRRSQALTDSQDRAKKALAAINAQKGEIILDEKLDERFTEAKETHQQAVAAERETAIALTSSQKELESTHRRIDELKARIKDMAAAKERLGSLRRLSDWLGGRFSSLASTIETHVLSSVHQEFSTLLGEWLSMLVADDHLGVRLDDSFTVIATLDGYETGIEHLSGGERTSVALAYRLALNRVVSDLMTRVKTKGLLILDEPTEGFSSEQLDHVRDVLTQTGCSQTIIVSHETKIESYVDHVIRVEKADGVSSVST